jgi:hypothetical protein
VWRRQFSGIEERVKKAAGPSAPRETATRVFVTGASEGLGRAFVTKLAA